jgi:hypothetical protein
VFATHLKRVTEKQRRKPKKERITDLSLLGLEPGKLYTFKGRYRKLYSIKESRYDKAVSKLCTNDHVIFLKADLWMSSANKHRTIHRRWLKGEVEYLERKNNRVISIGPCVYSSVMKVISYQHLYPLYSGMLFVGFGERFGWINITQMSKEALLQQFEKIDTTRKENGND